MRNPVRGGGFASLAREEGICRIFVLFGVDFTVFLTFPYFAFILRLKKVKDLI